MNFKKIIYIVIIFVLLSGCFYLGSLYGQKQVVNQQENTINIIAGNQHKRNSLSDIQVIDIWGAVNNKKSNGFGQLYFKVSQDQTEILVRLQNVPLKIIGVNNSIDLPNSLSIETASLDVDGLNYDYKQIGIINLDEPVNGLRSGEFSTTLDYSIFTPNLMIQRIVLRSSSNTLQNFFLDEDPNLPAQVRREPSPFFWVVL